MTLFEILAFFLKPIVLILEPYVQQFTQWITSSAFQRKIIKFIVGLIVLLILVGVSFVAYVSFYWLYIPQRGHVGQIHLQYDKPTAPGVIGHGPTAEVDFLRGGRYGQFLRADQAYDISVNLHVPASEKNVEIGNFMVLVTLQRADGTPIMTSSRPGILAYQSTPVKLMRTAFKAVPLVLDWSREDQHLKIPLVENYVEDAANPVARAFIEISTPELRVYKSTIHIVAHFHGLRYFMFYYKISTALVFMSVFIFWEIIFSVVTWQVLAAWFGSDAEALAIAHQLHQEPGTPRNQPGQFRQQQALRSPSNISSQTFTSPRQPQLQEQSVGQKSRLAPDSELEEEQSLLAGSSRSRRDDQILDQDDLDDDERDQTIGQRDLRGQASSLRDDAVVPERPLTPSQRRQAEVIERQQASSPSPVTQRSHLQRNTVVETDDGASTSGSTTTTASARRTTGRTGFTMSPSPSLQPPPPPPPSVLSERSSEFQMSGMGVGGRRTAVESEYTEEEYIEGTEDDEAEDDGDVTFDEDDFSEAAHLSHTGASSSVRSRLQSQARGSETRSGPRDGIGRSTGRA